MCKFDVKQAKKSNIVDDGEISAFAANAAKRKPMSYRKAVNIATETNQCVLEVLDSSEDAREPVKPSSPPVNSTPIVIEDAREPVKP